MKQPMNPRMNRRMNQGMNQRMNQQMNRCTSHGTKPRRARSPGRAHSRGVAAVEMALIAPCFFLAFFGALEVARVLYVWNTATEATRVGARTAVVCNAGAPAIKRKVQSLLPSLTDAEVTVEYFPAGCAPGSCSTVPVSVASTSDVTTFIPNFFPPPARFRFPTAATTLTIESQSSTIPGAGGGNNPMCV